LVSIRVRPSHSTAVKPGAAITRSRSRRSITSPLTISIRTGSWVHSKTPARS
jgi:hypothetical protein